MSELLPQTSKLKVVQLPGAPTRAALDRVDQLIVVTPHRVVEAVWRRIPGGARLQRLAKRVGGNEPLSSRLQNSSETGVVLGRLPRAGKDGKQLDPFKLLRLAGKLMAAALVDRPRSLGVLVAGLEDEQAADVARALVLAASAHRFVMPAFRGKPKTSRSFNQLKLFGLSDKIDLDRVSIEAESLNLVRWLTAMPANKLSAGSYHETLSDLAERHGWQMEFLDEDRLREMGAGAFLAVSQGNATSDAGIAHLRYRPAGTDDDTPSLALVGKGIMFDTGGNNLKPFKSMLDMHIDMAGSAVAVSTLQALTELGYPHAVDCWLALTENRISAEAYKSHDVVSALNGTTIEIVHTDAEGRMVLADTLALAGQSGPRVIIDYATLTGTCIHALTHRYSGVFSNRQQLNQVLVDAGHAAGERVWPFPMDADYEEELESKLADILQCSPDGGGDHILAARFLKHFVPRDSTWIHVDLSSVTSKSGLGQVPAGATGFGVRLTLQLLLDHAEALSAS